MPRVSRELEIVRELNKGNGTWFSQYDEMGNIVAPHGYLESRSEQSDCFVHQPCACGNFQAAGVISSTKMDHDTGLLK